MTWEKEDWTKLGPGSISNCGGDPGTLTGPLLSCYQSRIKHGHRLDHSEVLSPECWFYNSKCLLFLPN